MSAKHIIVICCVIVGIALGDIISIRLNTDPSILDDFPTETTGFSELRIPGTPVLPAKSVVLALPPGAEVSGVRVELTTPQQCEWRPLTITPPFLPISDAQTAADDAVRRWHENRVRCERSDCQFPQLPFTYTNVSYFGNIPYVRLTYFPIQYTPTAWRFYSSVEVAIDYTSPQSRASVAQWVEREAARFFANWNTMKQWYYVDAQNDSFDYVVITKDYLFPAFDSLLDWKNSIGFSARCVSVDSIISQYPGADTPDRIRNFLVDKYDVWGIQYVLIGGNVDLIPMKICYPDPAHNFDTPTDYYYAELTDDWDSDGDGYYGEYDQDSIGFTPEVIVGRLPWNTVWDISAIVGKTVKFEQDVGSWKNNALLLAAFSNFANEDGGGWPSCDGAVLMENVKDSLLSGWTYTRLYEDEGLCPSGLPHEQSLTQSNVVAEWSSGQYAVTNWSGHGNSYGAYRKIWLYDDGDSIPESSEIGWEPFIDSYDAPALNDDYASIVFAASCSNAASDDNLARELIRNGASGIVAATTYGWYTPGWEDPSDGNIMSLDYYFYYYLIGENQSVGHALFNAKMFYFLYLYFPDPWGGDPEWTPQQNMLDYVLFGDPSLMRQGIGVCEHLPYEQKHSSFHVRPNPMSEQGFVEFVMNTSGNVRVVLYDCAGRRTRILFQGNKQSGIHTVPIAIDDLPPGVYFVNVIVEHGDNNEMLMKKVVLF